MLLRGDFLESGSRESTSVVSPETDVVVTRDHRLADKLLRHRVAERIDGWSSAGRQRQRERDGSEVGQWSQGNSPQRCNVSWQQELSDPIVVKPSAIASGRKLSCMRNRVVQSLTNLWRGQEDGIAPYYIGQSSAIELAT